ncbi:hypothetical protein GGR57DRAFT_451690, partial [Xylariaceae sp. FL1272]
MEQDYTRIHRSRVTTSSQHAHIRDTIHRLRILGLNGRPADGYAPPPALAWITSALSWNPPLLSKTFASAYPKTTLGAKVSFPRGDFGLLALSVVTAPSRPNNPLVEGFPLAQLAANQSVSLPLSFSLHLQLALTHHTIEPTIWRSGLHLSPSSAS